MKKFALLALALTSLAHAATQSNSVRLTLNQQIEPGSEFHQVQLNDDTGCTYFGKVLPSGGEAATYPQKPLKQGNGNTFTFSIQINRKVCSAGGGSDITLFVPLRNIMDNPYPAGEKVDAFDTRNQEKK